MHLRSKHFTRRKRMSLKKALAIWSEPRRASSAASCSRSLSPSSFPATCCVFSLISRAQNERAHPAGRPFRFGAGGGTLNPAEQARLQVALSLSRPLLSLQLAVPSHPSIGTKRKDAPYGYALSLWCRWWDSEPRRASSAASCSLSFSPSSFPATCCAFSPINRHKAKGRTPRVRPFTLVPVVGLEPTRCRHQRILSPSRLPIPSHRLILFATDILYHIRRKKSSPNLRFFCGFAKISQHFQSS